MVVEGQATAAFSSSSEKLLLNTLAAKSCMNLELFFLCVVFSNTLCHKNTLCLNVVLHEMSDTQHEPFPRHPGTDTWGGAGPRSLHPSSLVLCSFVSHSPASTCRICPLCCCLAPRGRAGVQRPSGCFLWISWGRVSHLGFTYFCGSVHFLNFSISENSFWRLFL